MKRIWILSALVCAGVWSVGALHGAELEGFRRRPLGFYPGLPPERHVIERVWHAVSDRFIINGSRFAAKTPACVGWLAGERVKFVAGSLDSYGYCLDAVVYNATRRESCEMWCGGPASDAW